MNRSCNSEELKKKAKSENEPIRRSVPKQSAAVIGELKRRYQPTEFDSVSVQGDHIFEKLNSLSFS